MTRLRTFAPAVATVVVLIGVPVVGQEKKPQPEAYQRCAKACNDCQRICDACSTHCARLVAGGKREHVKTLQTCQDCADFCTAATRIVSRRGPFTGLVCLSCAEACARCGKACEQFLDDKMMKACAEECRRCERECRDMLKHVSKSE